MRSKSKAKRAVKELPASRPDQDPRRMRIDANKGADEWTTCPGGTTPGWAPVADDIEWGDDLGMPEDVPDAANAWQDWFRAQGDEDKSLNGWSKDRDE